MASFSGFSHSLSVSSHVIPMSIKFYLTSLRINHGQHKGSMRLAFAYVRVGGGDLLISRLLWFLFWNRFYFVIRGGNTQPTNSISKHKHKIK